MNNVIKFQKPKPVKPPRQTPPWARRLIILVVVIAMFAAAWAYFQFAQQSSVPGL